MDKPYLCNYCNVTFSRKYNLKRHKKVYHNYNSEEDDSRSPSETENETDSDIEGELDKMSTETMSDSDDREYANIESESENMSTKSMSDNDDGESTESDDEEVKEESMSDNDDGESTENDDEEVEEEEDQDVFRNLINDTLNHNPDELELLTEHYQETGMNLQDAAYKAFEDLQPLYRKILKQLFVNYIIDMFAKQRNPLFQSILRKKKVIERNGLDEDEAIKLAVSYRKYGIYNLLKSFPRDGMNDTRSDKEYENL